MPGKVVIADAGPLIALSRVDVLDLLHGLFGSVRVTPEVRAEVLPAGAYPGKEKIAGAFDAGWLQSPDLPKSAWCPVNPGLGPGERSTIAIALQLGDSLLIVDDRAARAEAQSLKLAIIGTAAVIGLAKQQGLISTARPFLERLQPAGYFIHPRIIAQVLKAVDE